MNQNSTRQVNFSRIETLIIILLVPVLIFLIWWNLEGYPVTSGWDEGIYLQFSQNLSHYGIYGTSDGGHFDTLIPAGGTGPILIGSVALAFKLFGDSLFSARFVITIFLIISIIGLYLLIRKVSYWEVACLSIFIYLIAGYEFYDTLWMGRQVLAEIPSIAFLFLGLWGLIKVINQKSLPTLISSLVLLGLSVVTKNQLIWILVPTMAVMTIWDLVFMKKNHWKVYLVATLSVLVGFLAWYFAALFLVGDNKTVYQESQSTLLIATYLRISFPRILENFYLFRISGFFFPIAIACLYAIITIFRNKGIMDQGRALLFFLAGFGLFSSIVISLPWARYIYTGIVLAIPFVSILLGDLILWLRSHRHTLIWYGLTLCLAVFIGFIALRLISDSKLILQTKNNDAQQFAEFVDHTVPTGSEVLNWEWEVEFFSHSDFIHPDFRLFPALIDQTYNKINSPILQNSRIPTGVHYLIIGPFASQNEVFTAEESQRAIASLGQVGAYSLFYVK